MQKYRLYIDESGDHTLYKTDEPSKRYLGLTGIMIECEYYRVTFQPALEMLKQKHFPYNPDDPVIFHREDMVNKQKYYWRLRDPAREKSFNEDLLAFLKEQQYLIISVVIDKENHYKKYKESAQHPYHYCLTAMLERYCGRLRFDNSIGDILAESRGGLEDTQLKLAYNRLYREGTAFRNSDFFQTTLTSHEIKLKPKWKNIAGLQVADILAHPCKQDILTSYGQIEQLSDNFGIEICKCIASKYNQHIYQERVLGYGKIFLG